MRGRSRRRTPSDASRQPQQAGDRQEHISLQLIASKLERLTWRRRIWGVDERQVWHVVQRMDEMYRQLYREQEVRYQALLSQTSSQPPSAQPAQAPSPAPTGAGTATPNAGPSAGPQSSAYVPLQAIPASRPPQRFRGETVATPPSPQPGQAVPSLGETRVMAPQPPTPGSHRFRTS